MNRWLVGAAMLALGSIAAGAQSLDDLNIQIHGYATQGFLYTTNNNILTTNSSNGSPAWTEAVVNVGAQPIPKLRIGVQGRYFLLGNYGNAITLDWAAGDYKVNDKFGIRFGKVKTPSGLFNELQDIDPSYMWALLPQSVYPIGSRNSELSHEGGVVYGTLDLGRAAGKVEYRGWGGERNLGSNDGFLLSQREEGLILPNGLGGAVLGGALHWKTPLRGLMVGASDDKNLTWSGQVTAANGALTGNEIVNPLNLPNYFGSYEAGKFSLAGEYARLAPSYSINFTGLPKSPGRTDNREWYGMANYKPTGKWTTGIYFSWSANRQAPLGPSRYQKDWAISTRYDFNGYLYAKAEQHFIDGTAINYDADLNPNGLKPDTRLTVLKIGVSF